MIYNLNIKKPISHYRTPARFFMCADRMSLGDLISKILMHKVYKKL